MILGFTGKARSGKSTASEFAKDILGNVENINMKDGLVTEMIQNLPKVLEVLGKQENMLLDELFAEKPPLMRALMQNYGTDVRRHDDSNYWVDKWKKTVLMCESDHVVCDDLRFLNEAEAITELEGFIVRIIRPGTTSGTHVSETEMDDIIPDYEIVNDGEVDKLYKDVYNLLDKFAEKCLY